MNYLFNGLQLTVCACIAAVGFGTLHSVNSGTYEVDVWELTSYRCDLGYAGACDYLATLEAE